MVRPGPSPGLRLGGLARYTMSSRENRWNNRYLLLLLAQPPLSSFQYFLFKTHPFPALRSRGLGGLYWPPFPHKPAHPPMHLPWHPATPHIDSPSCSWRLQDRTAPIIKAEPRSIFRLWPKKLVWAWAYDQSGLIRVNPELFSFPTGIKFKAADEHFTTMKKRENQNLVLPELFQHRSQDMSLPSYLNTGFLWLAAKSPDRYKK